MDLDVGAVQVHAASGNGATDVVPEYSREVLARERMCADPACAQRERLAGSERERRFPEDAFSERFESRLRLEGGAHGHDAEDPSEDPSGPGDVVHVDVDSGLIGLRDALDRFRGEEVLDVRHESVAKLAPDESTLQRKLPEPNE